MPYWLGSHRYLEEKGQETPEVHAQLEAMSEGGKSVVVVAKDDHVCGFVTLADELRPESAAAVADLKRSGVASATAIRVTFSDRHTVFGRAEVAGMPAHHLHAHEYVASVFEVGKAQLGYVCPLRAIRAYTLGWCDCPTQRPPASSGAALRGTHGT